MILAAAQIRSSPGDVTANIDSHRAAIRLACCNEAQIIIFPELSLTGYEPSLAEKLAFESGDERLESFSELSKEFGITIGVGVPTKTTSKPRISHAFFAPNLEDVFYSKQRLHEDELLFFGAGNQQACLRCAGETLVPAICYEALVPEHAEHAAELGATAYLACVAKAERGVTHAHAYFSELAERHQFSVVMCNAVGRSDNFISAGMSAAWNRKGERLACASASAQCLLLVNLATDEATIEPLDNLE